jgi:hypothetical protein
LKNTIKDALFTKLSEDPDNINNLNALFANNNTFDTNINESARLIMKFLVDNKDNDIIKKHSNLEEIETLISKIGGSYLFIENSKKTKKLKKYNNKTNSSKSSKLTKTKHKN